MFNVFGKNTSSSVIMYFHQEAHNVWLSLLWVDD